MTIFDSLQQMYGSVMNSPGRLVAAARAGIDTEMGPSPLNGSHNDLVMNELPVHHDDERRPAYASASSSALADMRGTTLTPASGVHPAVSQATSTTSVRRKKDVCIVQ
jgi:hypothetical protein